MRITYITAGAGKMYCGTCLRDGALAAELGRLGHDITLIPTYTPLRLEGESIAIDRLFLGGINVFLQDKMALFRHTPRFIDRLFDSAPLLRWASGFGHMTAASDVAQLTISMLEGDSGRQIKEINRLLKWLEEQPLPDLVLLPNTMLAGVGRAIAQRLKVPVVSFVSGEDLFINEFPEPWKTRTRQALQRQVRHCTGFIAHNSSYAAFMAGFLDIPIESFRIAPLGIDCSDYPESVARKRKYDSPYTIGFLARICPQKGLHLLAEAFHLLRQNPAMRNCRLMAAGYLAPEYRSYLDGIRSSFQQWGLADSFEYAGELERSAKIQFLQGLDIFCVPSLYCEAKAQFAPEAMAAGVPIVVPRVGGLTEWIEQTGGGIIVDRDNPQALAEGISVLISESARALEMGRRGREAVMRNHSITKMAESIGKIAQDLASPGGSGMVMKAKDLNKDKTP